MFFFFFFFLWENVNFIKLKWKYNRETIHPQFLSSFIHPQFLTRKSIEFDSTKDDDGS